MDQVKLQIVQIVTDKNDSGEGNAILKSYQSAFITLTDQNDLLKTKLLEHSKMLDISVIVDSPEADRTSPDGQEIDGDQTTFKSSVEYEAELQNIKERNKALEDENKLSLTLENPFYDRELRLRKHEKVGCLSILSSPLPRSVRCVTPDR